MITLKNIILPILIALLAISILYGFIRFLLRIIGISTSFTTAIFVKVIFTNIKLNTKKA